MARTGMSMIESISEGRSSSVSILKNSLYSPEKRKALSLEEAHWDQREEFGGWTSRTDQHGTDVQDGVGRLKGCIPVEREWPGSRRPEGVLFNLVLALAFFLFALERIRG